MRAGGQDIRHHLAALLAPVPAVSVRLRKPVTVALATVARDDDASDDALGLFAHDLHALRYRDVMGLAWAGRIDGEITFHSGHAAVEMVRLYAGEARQIMQARETPV